MKVNEKNSESFEHSEDPNEKMLEALKESKFDVEKIGKNTFSAEIHGGNWGGGTILLNIHSENFNEGKITGSCAFSGSHLYPLSFDDVHDQTLRTLKKIGFNLNPVIPPLSEYSVDFNFEFSPEITSSDKKNSEKYLINSPVDAVENIEEKDLPKEEDLTEEENEAPESIAKRIRKKLNL